MKIFLALISLAGLLTFASCKGKSTPVSPQEVVKAALLNNQWKIKSVDVDGIDQTILFKDFAIQFTATQYTTINGEPVWPSSGGWKFNSDDGTTLVREDGLIITINITGDLLTLSLDWSKTTLGGRAKSIKGFHVFSL